MFDEVIRFVVRVMDLIISTPHLPHVEINGLPTMVGVDTMRSIYRFFTNDKLQLLLDKLE